MGRLKRLALWGCAVLMAVTAVAVGELDPTWATSPTDAAREAGVSGAGGPPGAAAGPPAKAGPRSYGLSGLVLASSHCPHGQWSSGRCRACPVGQVWITGTGCVTATDTRRCSSGNTYFSSYRGCRPTTCANGRTSTGTCRPACPSGQTYFSFYGGCRPTICANGRTSTGTCRTCPAGQSYFSSYGGCRPTICANGRTSTGACRTCPAGQSYFSSYGGCRPTICANGRTSTGACRTCPAGQTYLSAYSGCRPTSCKNGRRSNGTCRSCADPTHMRRDGACRPKLVPAATDPPCPAGQLYYSSYGGCRPSSCANGRTSTGTCRACPAGQTQLPAFGATCVPANCDYGYTNTGTCEDESPSHRYTALKCLSYSADATAREYLDIDDKLDRATCPPQGLFLASPKVEDWPTWGFQKTVAKYYGKVVAKEPGDCSVVSDTGPSYDFQIPCKAHDYCFDLRRAGLSGTVLDDDCDDVANSLMIADCKDRTIFKKISCNGMKAQVNVALATPLSYTGPSPGAVNFVNVKTGKCISVKDSSTADGADMVQSSCINSENQRFLLHPLAGNRPNPRSGSPGYFQIKPVHSSGQSMCVAVVVSSLKQKSCSSSSLQQAFGLDSVSGDTWAVKRKNLSRSCWTVPETDSSGRAVTPADGTALVNVLCTPASRSNQVWRIQEAGSQVLSTRLRTTPTTTAPPATTTPPTTAPPATTAPSTTEPPAVTVPAAPSGLTATAGADLVTLSWNDPGDSSITSYQVRERPAFDGVWWCWSGFEVSPSGGKVTRRVRKLPSGVAYEFQVRAKNAAGFGPASEVSATTSAAASPPASAPAAPSGLSGAAGNQSIALSWTNPSDSSIIRYQFRERSDNEANWRCWRHIYNSTSTTVTHTMPGISNGLRYRVQIRALNAAGAGATAETSATPTAGPTRPSP